jgi:maltose alpha-D-glucosyltransferase / alpha-amylase
MKDSWYHNAIFYALDVETYMDSDGDGIGDFVGLMQRLHHLSGLGINCIWLRPFYPSPLADDGYDVMEYYNVDPRFGNMGDFSEFMAQAKALGIRVIIDLVVNHTSNQHVWFQKAREDEKSPYRDFYIWKEKPTEDDKQPNMIGQGGIWNHDRKAGAYYLHHFMKEQPDLNVGNPKVINEIKKIMGFWLALGVSGFRIDAAHIIVSETKDQVYEVLEEMRSFVSRRNHEAILLGEANVESNELQKFFGGNCDDGKRLHLLFNFNTNKAIFLAMASKSAAPLIQSLKDLKGVDGSWVNFIRLHDELNLEMLSEKELKQIFEAFAPDENMRIFGHGIRRRLPPMLESDRKRMELIYCIMFSLPGMPLINYGEEIAMGDDLSEKGRNSVRTVMQWDSIKNAGFSTAAKNKLAHPAISSGDYDYDKVNVRKQQKEPDSFLNWMARLISVRRHSPQLSYGACTILENSVDSVFSFFNVWETEAVILMHNLDDSKCKVKLELEGHVFENPSEIFSNQEYDEVEDISKKIELSGYGYRWFRATVKEK